MEWTRNMPKEEGYYWCLRGEEPVVAKVYKAYGNLFVDTRLTVTLVKEFHDSHFVRTYWCGPIEMYPDFSHLDRTELD